MRQVKMFGLSAHLSDGLLHNFEARFDEALARGLPPFPLPLERANRTNASPFLITEHRFWEAFGKSGKRQRQLGLLNDLRQRLQDMGLRPVFALVGGSFVDHTEACPGDLDILLFYEGPLDIAVSLMLQQDLVRLQGKGLDCQLHPADIAPVLVARIAAFYAGLYLQQRGDKPPRATVMVMFESLSSNNSAAISRAPTSADERTTT